MITKPCDSEKITQKLLCKHVNYDIVIEDDFWKVLENQAAKLHKII